MNRMGEKKSWRKILLWKLVTVVILIPMVWIGGGQLGFPDVFRWMFVFYVILGGGLFILIDIPLPKEVRGWKAGASVVIFFLIVAVLFTVVGHLWPQFSHEHEVAGIERKTKMFREQVAAEGSLLKKTQELSAKADAILARLSELQAAGVKVKIEGIDMASLTETEITFNSPLVAADDLVERGKLVYQDHECYNCHKIGGKGGKKRGPELDNIGNLVSAEQLKDKIFNPKAWYAEGYEKRTKDKMPDNYPDIMSEEELEALVAYLMTLKNPAVKTPKPVFPTGS